jgi:hypothetical protein
MVVVAVGDQHGIQVGQLLDPECQGFARVVKGPL